MNFCKKLSEYTEDELVDFMNHADEIGMTYTGIIALEILRRMNERKPLLIKEDNDWGNPLTP